MLEKSLGLLFYLKRRAGQSKAEVAVYLRITVDGVSKEVSTKRSWTTGKWDVRSGRAIGKGEDARSLNMLLETLNLKAHEARRWLLEEGKEVTADAIKNILSGGSDQKMILQVFAAHNQQVRELIGKEYAEGTLDLFQRTYEHTKNFILWKYNCDDLDIRKLDYEFISDFSFYLKSKRNNQHNTAVKYLTYFKKIVLLCVKKGWLTKDPFSNFKMTKKEVDREYLTLDELHNIAGKVFVSDRLKQVRDIFLFSCYTGLAYADVQKLQKSEVINNGKDGFWINTARQKTSTASRIPLLEIPLNIILEYQEHPQCVNRGTVLPVLTNQKMNAYLKEIADVCGISKKLTFHIARHTFATSVTLNNGVPIESVSKMLGHKNLKQTQHYAKLLDKKVGQDMAALKERLNGI